MHVGHEVGEQVEAQNAQRWLLARQQRQEQLRAAAAGQEGDAAGRRVSQQIQDGDQHILQCRHVRAVPYEGYQRLQAPHRTSAHSSPLYLVVQAIVLCNTAGLSTVPVLMFRDEVYRSPQAAKVDSRPDNAGNESSSGVKQEDMPGRHRGRCAAPCGRGRRQGAAG